MVASIHDAPDVLADGPDVRRVVRALTIFDRDQVDEPALRMLTTTPLGDADRAAVARIDAFADGLGADVRRGGLQAFHHRRTDSVMLPPVERFTGTAACTPGIAYASALAHALVLWSGSGGRAARPIEPGRVGYAREALVAGLGAARLAAELGFVYGGVAEDAGDVPGWLELLRGDERTLVRAWRDATVAATWLLVHGLSTGVMRGNGTAVLADV